MRRSSTVELMRGERTRRFWLWWLLLPPLLLFGPVFPSELAIYTRVGSDSFDQSIHRPLNSQGFVLEDGKLYLLRQQTWHALVLVTWVHHIDWSIAELQELRQSFPELDNDALCD